MGYLSSLSGVKIEAVVLVSSEMSQSQSLFLIDPLIDQLLAV